VNRVSAFTLQAVVELVEATGITVFLVPSTSSGTGYKVNAVALPVKGAVLFIPN
jgi:hypothetical protein